MNAIAEGRMSSRMKKVTLLGLSNLSSRLAVCVPSRLGYDKGLSGTLG